jgi:hypothetical protein
MTGKTRNKRGLNLQARRINKTNQSRAMQMSKLLILMILKWKYRRVERVIKCIVLTREESSEMTITTPACGIQRINQILQRNRKNKIILFLKWSSARFKTR